MADIIRPIRWDQLRADEAERVVRNCAAASAKVLFGEHAFDRIKERSITQIDAYAILRLGRVEGTPRPAENGRDWIVTVVRRMPGGREAGVVTVIFRPPDDELFVVTVEWMDTLR